MTSDRRTGILICAPMALAASVLLLSGCEKPPPPPPPAPPPEPVAPPAPDPVSVEGALREVNADARVQVNAAGVTAVVDRTFARAVAELASRIAKGDSDGLRATMTSEAQSILDGLVSSGEWDQAVARIEGLRIVRVIDNLPTGEASMNDATVFLAIQEPGVAYLVAFDGRLTGGNWLWTGARSASMTRPRASQFDTAGELSADPAPAAPAPAEAPAAPGGATPPPAGGGMGAG